MTGKPANSVSFDKQGHRGCRGLMPENTIPAMLHALQLGVNTLEMDIVFTKDNVAILSHEPFFNHEITTTPTGNYIEETAEKNYNIYTMSFAETQLYDVGIKPHPRFTQQQKIAAHKPSLAALFDSVQQYVSAHKTPFPYFNIETKSMPVTDNSYHPAPGVFVEELMKVIIEKKMQQWVTIQSFDIRTLQYLHINYPTIKSVLLIEDYDKRPLAEQLQQLGFNPTTYSPHFSLVTPALIEQCHQQQIKVIPWTVNDLPTMKQLISLGADGIITDYPNLFNDL